MLDFIEYLRNERIIEDLKKYYKNSFSDNSNWTDLEEIYENLNSLQSNTDFKKEGKLYSKENLELDIISSLYEYTLNHKQKKELGEFYTPIQVINYILNATGYRSVNNVENKKIIDISCGSGSFIIQTIRILIKRYLEIYGKKNISELSSKEAKEIISRVKNNIFGIDINQIACVLCQINIHFELFEVLKLIRASDSDYILPKFNIENSNALTIDFTENFDYVVGNPPYIFIRDIPYDQRNIIESRDFETNEGQYDYYQIFLELGIKILKPQGKLGYIVPDSLLALSNRSTIRKFIYNTTKIKEIYHTGPKFDDPIVSNIIIILEKEPNIMRRKENLMRFKALSNFESSIPQEIIEKWNYKFLIHLNRIDISIMEHMTKNFIKLKDLSRLPGYKFSLSRGVELTKTGEIIYCENCNVFLPVPIKNLKCNICNKSLNKEKIETIIFDNIPDGKKEKNLMLFLYSIGRYQKTQYKFIDISKVGINYKNLSIYEDRIVIRQISQNNRICATYEKNMSLTSQSFYNLKIMRSAIPEFNHYYLLGILNSTLLSYFFIKSFGTYKRLFPRILIEKIKEFPLKIPSTNKDKQKAEKISKKVKMILDDIDKLENLQQQIDTIIFDLYQIPESNRKYILNCFNNLSP